MVGCVYEWSAWKQCDSLSTGMMYKALPTHLSGFPLTWKVRENLEKKVFRESE